MDLNNRTDTVLTNQKGVAVIIVALCITFLLGIAALAIDIGYRNVAKNELQNIADAAALAGADELGRQYLDESFVTVDETLIVGIAQNVANSNSSGFNIEVQVGTWIDDRDPLFIDDDCSVIKCNAVRAITRRGSPYGVSDGNPQVPTFFARIWNILGLDLEKDGVAALTGAKTVAEGDLEIPVGISKDWFERDFCDQNIQFYPTAGTEGCSGWHVYDTWPASAAKLRDDILGGMLADPPTFVSPEIDLDPNDGDGCIPESCNIEFAFTGGNLSTTLDNISDLFEAKREWVCDESGSCEWIWKTKVVVYDEPCGENPNQTVSILGFASVEITGVVGPPPVLIAKVDCGEVNEGGGGGSYYGIWGSIPDLVEDDHE